MENLKPILFPPAGYRPTVLNLFLANALELTAPASDALLKNRKNPWIQLAGHPGSFAPAGPHTIWKKRMTKENNETLAYQHLMNDVTRNVAPKFYREVEYNGDFFIEMEDLLQHFSDPSIMDMKMGTRTFLEAEVKNPVLRKDLYEKMIKLDPMEPTQEEHELKAITKLRYMQFREKCSSTSTLGFRIEAMKKMGKTPSTDLKKIRTRDQVRWSLAYFLGPSKEVHSRLLHRLRHIRTSVENSPYLKNHEIIGSSLLIMYDQHEKCSAWMIDFAKTLPIPEGSLDHRTTWAVGNHEDGYLVGLDNLIDIISEPDFYSLSEAAESAEEASEKGEHEKSEKDNRKQAAEQAGPARQCSGKDNQESQLAKSVNRSPCEADSTRKAQQDSSANVNLK